MGFQLMRPPSIKSLLLTTAAWCPKRRQKLATGSCCAAVGDGSSDKTRKASKVVENEAVLSAAATCERDVDPSQSADGLMVCTRLAVSSF